jgi:cilia- and flagella-associated protein 298
LNAFELLQRSEQQQFLFETTVDALVKDTLDSLVIVHNLRQRIAKLKLEGGELAKHGLAKQPDKQGIDTYVEEGVQKGEHYSMDPTGRRDGNGALPKLLLPHTCCNDGNV